MYQCLDKFCRRFGTICNLLDNVFPVSCFPHLLLRNSFWIPSPSIPTRPRVHVNARSIWIEIPEAPIFDCAEVKTNLGKVKRIPSHFPLVFRRTVGSNIQRHLPLLLKRFLNDFEFFAIHKSTKQTYDYNRNYVIHVILIVNLMIKMIEVLTRDWEETSRAAHAYLHCIFTHTQLQISTSAQTCGRARATSSLHPFTPSSPVILSPLGHRRSTIDASSLAASIRIYGNVYVARSYIRGFWRIAYIREILITWPTRHLLPPPLRATHTHTISEGEARSFLRQRKYGARPMRLSFALYWRSVSAFRPICLPSSLPSGISFHSAQCLTF